MAIPQHVRRKLQETLGAEAAEALVTWIEEADAHRGDVAELRHEMQISFARMEALIEKRLADLLKWSFVFWVGAVGAVAALAGVLR